MIMDGNTRWSKENNVDIKQGYIRGLKNIKNGSKQLFPRNRIRKVILRNKKRCQ